MAKFPIGLHVILQLDLRFIKISELPWIWCSKLFSWKFDEVQPCFPLKIIFKWALFLNYTVIHVWVCVANEWCQIKSGSSYLLWLKRHCCLNATKFFQCQNGTCIRMAHNIPIIFFCICSNLVLSLVCIMNKIQVLQMFLSLLFLAFDILLLVSGLFVKHCFDTEFLLVKINFGLSSSHQTFMPPPLFFDWCLLPLVEIGIHAVPDTGIFGTLLISYCTSMFYLILEFEF